MYPGNTNVCPLQLLMARGRTGESSAKRHQLAGLKLWKRSHVSLLWMSALRPAAFISLRSHSVSAQSPAFAHALMTELYLCSAALERGARWSNYLK